MTEEEKKGDVDKKEGVVGKKQAAAEAAANKEVIQMKAGDYTIHLLIQKAKDLHISEEGTMNVIVEVEVQGKKQCSKEIKDVTVTTVCNFGSHIFFELLKQSVAELEATKIVIRLSEKSYFKNALIGQIELDLTYLYNLKERTQEHQWVALINPEDEDFSTVAAYLKTSASVYGVEDTPKELKVDEAEDNDNCIMPASIKPKYTQLKMHIVRAEHLPRLDRNFTGPVSMDAYIQTMIGKKKLKTSVQLTVKDACVWNETFLIPVRLPIMSGKLILDVMDHDAVNDEQAGTLVFDFKDLLNRDQKSFFWANVYGAPGGEDLVKTNKEVQDQMNKDPNIATLWKGRVLIGIEYELEVERPMCGKEAMSTAPPSDAKGQPFPMSRSTIQLAEEYTRPKKYLLMYEFGTVNNIPEKSGGFNLRLKIGEHKFDSLNGKVAEKLQRSIGYNYNRWNQRSKQIEIELPYGNQKEMDDIFLYLCPDEGGGIGSVFNLIKGGESEEKVKNVGNPISYIRLKAADFTDPNPKIKWVEMITEPVENKIKSPELAGVVSFRLSIVRADSGVHLESQENWKKTLARRPKSAKIRCYLFQCKNLPAADDDGASDPIITIFSTINNQGEEATKKKQVKETQMIEDNCDPMFYECIELTVDYVQGEDTPPFIFDVYDIDSSLFGKNDSRDYIGRAVILLKDSSHKTVYENTKTEDLKPMIPKWHPIRYAAGMPTSGEILVSFLFAEIDDYTWNDTKTSDVVMMGMYDDKAVVRFDEFKVELNVLGLRGLQSAGLLPVKKAYIDFLLKSMVPPMAASALDKISTQPGPTGPNPTINSVIEFQTPMPLDPLYAPSMACRVYDKVFKGFSGQLIGSFIIPIGDIMQDQQVEYDENAKKLDDVIRELEKILLKEPVVKDYNSMNKVNDDQLLTDKSFRETQQKEKEVYKQVMQRDAEEEKKTFTQKITQKIADKIIAPEPVKPTTAMQKKIAASNKTALTQRLIMHVDEDSDSDGETYTNSVAKQDTEKMKYVPPQIMIPSINEDRFDMDALAATPRSQLSNQEKNALDREAILDVISQKSNPDKLKSVVPKEGEKFMPPTPIKITKLDVENAIKVRSGQNTPANQSGLKSFNSARSGMGKALVQMSQDTQAAISRDVDEKRKIAQKEYNEKNGKPMIAIIYPAKYKKDDRLNCHREIDKPPSLLFEEIGWDRDPENPKEKHYRRFFLRELEQCKEVMSKPSEFQSFKLRKGQSRGASKGFSFFGGKKDQATGEEDTTQEMGIFKALITVTHKETENERKRFMMLKLTKIRQLLGQIYQMQTKKEFPLPQNFFCDEVVDGVGISRRMTKDQRERVYSDDIKVQPSQLMINTGGETFTSKTNKAQDTGRSKKSIQFDNIESTVLNAEGRTKFKELIKTMNLMHLQILKKVVDVQSDQIVKRLLMVEMRCNVRVYILRAINLAERDNDSPSDPYVKVILGEQEHSDVENWQLDEPNPEIYKKFEFNATFPGCPHLKIQFWDYDMLFGHDFIGETIVDVEDRYFSTDFKSYTPHKPIEHRQLHHPNTEMSQGTVVTWIEINETSANANVAPVYDISKKPEEDFEVRVIIWDTEELKMCDLEGTTDGFVRVFFESDSSKDTDTHFRNSDGKCSWNYRLLFPFRHPAKNNNYKLTLQAYDLDLFKSNDLIGTKVIDLRELIHDSELAKRPISLTKDYYDQFLVPEGKMKSGDLTFDRDDSRQFWVNLDSKEDGKPVINGRLKMSVEVYPKKEAEANPVGSGQSEPNVNPFLPKPFGRIEFSINPLKMLMQLVGPALRRKLYCYCCILLCCALCIMMAPMIFSNIIVNILTPG